MVVINSDIVTVMDYLRRGFEFRQDVENSD